MFKGLAKRLVAAFAAAGAALVAVIALGATIYYALALVLTPLGAAAVTAGLFALVAVVAAMAAAGKAEPKPDPYEDEEPESLATRAFHLVKQRPIIGVGAGLFAAFMLLRNPALAAMLAATITEKRHQRRRRW
jgi:Na+-transporting methylmalonyl-CoA/oxaloacetate decarboxylase gamma subunit